MRPPPIEINLSLPLDLPADETQALEITLAYWEKELGFTCEAERTLIRNMAAARVQINRCDAANDAHLKLAAHKAQAQERAERRQRIRKLAQSLPKRPAATVEKLEATQEGRDWLANRWRDLEAPLAQGVPLTDKQRRLALHLTGCLDAPPGPDAPAFVRQLHAALTDAQQLQARPESTTDPIAARRWLRALCDHHRTRLEDLNLQTPTTPPDPEAEALAQHQQEAHLASARLQPIDPSAKARRQIRHQADQSYARNLGLLMRLRNGRQREREWELKEARRRPPADDPRARPVANAHQPAHRDATPTPAAHSVESPASAPQRTNDAPTGDPGGMAAALCGHVRAQPASPAPPPGAVAPAGQVRATDTVQPQTIATAAHQSQYPPAKPITPITSATPPLSAPGRTTSAPHHEPVHRAFQPDAPGPRT